MFLALRIIIILAGAYLLVLLYLWLMQPRLIFYPDLPGRELVATPARLGLPWEEVWLRSADGTGLHGWFLPAVQPRAVLLFLHGNAGNISHRLESLALFHRLGLSVLIFDYRGYGRSGGRVSEQGLHLDAEAAWNHLVRERNLEPGEILIFGRSLGASLAASLAAGRRPLGLVLESAFTSVPEIAHDLYPLFPVRLLARFRFDTRAALREVRAPVLILHSREDEIIPFSHGRALYEAAPQPKFFFEMRGGHNDGFLASGDGYLEAWAGFIDWCLAHRSAGAPAAPPAGGM